MLPLNIKGASRFLRKWPLATLDTEPPEALWPETKGQVASLARIRGHPLHGAGGHQANSRGQPGKGVLTGADSNSNNQQQASAVSSTRGHPTLAANWGYVRPLAERRSTTRSHREPGLRITGPCPRDVPEQPSIANDSHQQQPANMKLGRALSPRATHGNALVMRRSSVRVLSREPEGLHV